MVTVFRFILHLWLLFFTDPGRFQSSLLMVVGSCLSHQFAYGLISSLLCSPTRLTHDISTFFSFTYGYCSSLMVLIFPLWSILVFCPGFDTQGCTDLLLSSLNIWSYSFIPLLHLLSMVSVPFFSPSLMVVGTCFTLSFIHRSSSYSFIHVLQILFSMNCLFHSLTGIVLHSWSPEFLAYGFRLSLNVFSSLPSPCPRCLASPSPAPDPSVSPLTLVSPSPSPGA